ncbi:MAG: hypothetical protein K2Y51_17780 [Gammaproteobacteria bacterium]|nr:hypothetical protein [Gammaproteobacteria bacterium]
MPTNSEEGRTTGGAELPWVAAWRAWLEQLGSREPSAADTRAAAAGGFASAYLEFARAIQRLLDAAGPGDFSARLIAALRGGAADAALNEFLRAAPAAMLHGLAGERASQPWAQWSATLTRWTEELLRLPLIGPAREWQSLVRAVQRAAVAEGAARDRLAAHLHAVLRAAQSHLADRLEQDDGPPITTLRALYDLWIECAEQAYAERVMGDDFARDFAAWVDAGSDLRLAVNALLARAAGAVDAPRREEIDALLQRQRILEAQLAALQAARVDERRSAPPSPAPTAEVTHATPAAPQPAPRPRQPRKAERKPAPPKAQAKPRTPRPETTKPAAPRPARKPGAEFDIAEILGMGK